MLWFYDSNSRPAMPQGCTDTIEPFEAETADGDFRNVVDVKIIFAFVFLLFIRYRLEISSSRRFQPDPSTQRCFVRPDI